MNDRYRAAILALVPRGVLPLVVAGGLLVGFAVEGSAQRPLLEAGPDLRETRFSGVGFAATLPNSLTGAAAFHTFPSLGFGVFATARFRVRTPADEPNFESGMTVAEAFAFNDLPVGNREVQHMASGGLMRPVTETVAVFLGAGYTRERTYREFHDESLARGNQGYYWVEDDRLEKTGVNYTGGVLIQLNQHLFFMGGLDSFPRGVSMAVMLSMPW